jgi:RHS repeat-associated protein
VTGSDGLHPRLTSSGATACSSMAWFAGAEEGRMTPSRAGVQRCGKQSRPTLRWALRVVVVAVSLAIMAFGMAPEARAQQAPPPVCQPACVNPPPVIQIGGVPSFTTASTMTPQVELCSVGYGVAAESVFVRGTLTSWPWTFGAPQVCPDSGHKAVTLTLGNNAFRVDACSSAGGGNLGSCGSSGVVAYYDNVQVTPHTINMDGGVGYDTSVVFTITNYQSTSGTFNLGTTCTGLTSCINKLGSSVTIAGNSSVLDTVDFTTGALNSTGTLKMKAVYSSNGAGLDSGIVSVTAVWANILAVSSSYTNEEDQDYGRCAFDCFAAMQTVSTVPYIARDVARSESLIYNGDRLAPRPFVLVDVTPLSSTYALTDIQLQVQSKVNGTYVTFLNGEDTLHFSPTGLTCCGPYRIGGQLNAMTNGDTSNASWPIRIIVTALFTDNRGAGQGVVQIVDSTHFLSINRSWPTGYPRGWTIADYSRLYWDADTTVVNYQYMAVGDGDGSVRVYGPVNSTCSHTVTCVWLGAPGVTDTLVWYNPANTLERHFVDGTKWVYSLDPTLGGSIIYRIDRANDTTKIKYLTGTTLIDSISDPMLPALTYTIIHYTSDTTHRLTSIAEPGSAPSFTPGGGRVTTVRVSTTDSTLQAWFDPDGDSTTFGYDAAKRLTSVVNRRRDTTKFVYATDSSWKLSQVVSPAVPVDTGTNGPTGSTQRQSPTVTYTNWQTAGVPHVRTDVTPGRPVVTSSVGATVVGALQDTSTFTPDRWGEGLILVDALHDTTTIARDNNGYPRSIAHADGGHASLFYSSAGLLSSQAPPGGVNTFYGYGVYGQVDSIYGPQSPETEMFLNATHGGRVDSTKINGAAKTAYTYDGLDRTTQIVDPAGHTQLFSYWDDLSANVATLNFDWSGQGWQKWYDAHGRLQVTGLGGGSQSYAADTFYYDSVNRVVAVSDGKHPVQDSTYYDGLYQTTQTDAKGQRWLFGPIASGLDSTVTDPRGGVTRYTYTAAGNIATITNRRAQRLVMKYDKLGRLIYKYDPAAGDTVKIAYSTSLAGSWLAQSVWTAAGRLETDTTYMDSTSWTDSVKTYITAINKTYVQHYKKTIRNQLDSVWVTGVTLSPTWATQRFVWDTITGLRDSSYINSNGTRYHYNVEELVDSTYYSGGAVRFDTVMDTHQLITTKFSQASLDTAFHRAYMYDSAGRLTEIDRDAGTGTAVDQIRYDGTGNVATQVLGTAARSYLGSCAANKPDCTSDGGVTVTDSAVIAYDSAGNLRSITDAQNTSRNVTATYLSDNRDTTWIAVGDSLNYKYDADGNRTQRATRGDTVKYSWSADGRLLSVTAGTHVINYQYYPDGLLMQRSFGSVVDRYYLWDRGNLRAELDSTGTHRVNEYVFDGTDQPLARITSTGTLYYLQQDARSNVVGAFSGSTVEQDIAYGLLGGVSGVGTLTGDTTNLRWKGLYWESDSTKLYYVRARWYDPVNHRFISQDPLGLAVGLNSQVFGGGDPVNPSDASGLCLSTVGSNMNGDSAVVGATESFGAGDQTVTFVCADDGKWYYVPVLMGNVITANSQSLSQANPDLSLPDVFLVPQATASAGGDGFILNFPNGGIRLPPTQTRLFGMHWCGPGGGGTPVNALDIACMNHDRCYDRIGATWKSNFNFEYNAALQQCNQALCDAAMGPARNNPHSALIWEFFYIAPFVNFCRPHL